MHIVGVDLSGPSNTDDTALVEFAAVDDGLVLRQAVLGATDGEILDAVTDLARRGEVVVGLDAPLSYNPSGGDRPADAALRKRTIAAGMHPGSVMPPTMTRMVYLTLRGVSVARALEAIPGARPRIVEVHPGATMALREAPLDAVRAMKGSVAARRELLAWLTAEGLRSITEADQPSDHYVAACAAALAAWRWSTRDSAWLHAADPPWRPYDYAC